jgi:hypothetical protein
MVWRITTLEFLKQPLTQRRQLWQGMSPRPHQLWRQTFGQSRFVKHQGGFLWYLPFDSATSASFSVMRFRRRSNICAVSSPLLCTVFASAYTGTSKTAFHFGSPILAPFALLKKAKVAQFCINQTLGIHGRMATTPVVSPRHARHPSTLPDGLTVSTLHALGALAFAQGTVQGGGGSGGGGGVTYVVACTRALSRVRVSRPSADAASAQTLHAPVITPTRVMPGSRGAPRACTHLLGKSAPRAGGGGAPLSLLPCCPSPSARPPPPAARRLLPTRAASAQRAAAGGLRARARPRLPSCCSPRCDARRVWRAWAPRHPRHRRAAQVSSTPGSSIRVYCGLEHGALGGLVSCDAACPCAGAPRDLVLCAKLRRNKL